MKEYEILFIVKPHQSDETNQEVVSTFEKWITSTGGEVTLMKPWGLKELATVFDKHTHGYYVQCQFKAGNETLNEIKNRLAVSEVIFRHLMVTLDSIQSSKPPKVKVKKAAAQPKVAVEG